jgi:sugar lactone lactonase YvrE
VTDLKVDDANVYLATQRGQVLAVPVGGGAETVLATSQAANDGDPALAIDDAHVYFTGGGTVSRVPKAGGATTTLVSGEHQGIGLAFAGGALLWSEMDADPGCHCDSGVIHRMPASGGSPTALVSNLGFVLGVAADTGSVYWIESGSVKRASLDGGGVTTLATGQQDATGLAVDAANVYWTVDTGQVATCGVCPAPPPPKPTDSTIYRVPLGGGAPVAVANGTRVDSVATDGTNLYWVDTYAKTLSTVAVAGGTPTVLATGVTANVGPVVDDLAITWVDGDWNVQRMPKAP